MPWILKVRDKFSAAHYLKNYKGKCEKVHGHTFEVEVQIEVDRLNETGIGYDFIQIKNSLSELLPDHSFLNEVFDFNPSAENLSRYFYHEMKKLYPVKKVIVWESDTSSAEYYE
ncbi:MAG: 6-carboxytetrahydropterin synthase [Acidobacteriota bacterium]